MSSFELPQRVSKAQAPRESPIPAHLQCSSCSKPLFNAFQTPHGCRLCQPCVTDLLSPSERRRCPGTTEACRDPDEDTEVSQSTCLPDMATRREVGRLQVLCPNCSAGCSVALSWTRMDEHLDSCDFQTVECELCSQPVMRKDSRRHAGKECVQRKEKCDLCSQQVTFSELNVKHKNLESESCCPRFSAPCPHCGSRRKKLDRRGYLAHLSECPERPVDCKYSHLGCRVKVRRSDIEKHYKDASDVHISLMDAKLRSLGSAAATVQTQASVGQPGVISEIPDLKRRIDALHTAFKKLQVNVANWSHTLLEFEQMADRFGGIAPMRDALQRLSERAQQMQGRSAAPSRNPATERPSHDGSPTSSTMLAAQSSNLLQQQFSGLESRLTELECTCYDGNLSWRVRNISAEMLAPASKPLESVPFFLRRFGRAFRLHLYLNGKDSGSGTHMSVYLVHVAQKLDDPLDWPIKAEATFRLINLKDRRRSVQKTVTLDTSQSSRPEFGGPPLVCCGEPRLLPHSEFNEQFLKLDCCFLQVEVREQRTPR